MQVAAATAMVMAILASPVARGGLHFALVIFGGLASLVPITGRVWSTAPEGGRAGAMRGLNVWFAAWGVTYTLAVVSVSIHEGVSGGLAVGIERAVRASIAAWPMGLLMGWILLIPTAGLALLLGWLLGRRHAHDRAALGEGR